VRTLRACLADEPLPRLMAMADLWEAPIEATSAGQVAESLAAFMAQPERAQAAYQALPAEARAALDAMIAARGRMPAATFERRFGQIRPMGPGRLERERPWLAPVSPAEALWYRGFIFRAFDRAPGAPVEIFFVPSDLYEALGPASQEGAFDLRASPPAPSTGAQDAPLLDDLTTLLCFAHNHEVQLTADGGWPLKARRALAPMLRDPEGATAPVPSGRFAWLLHLATLMGWVRAEEGRLRLAPGPVLDWLRSDAEAQLAALMDAWLSDATWNDLAHVPTLKLEMTHAWSYDAPRARRAIAALWQDWQAEHKSGATEAFVRYVQAHAPDFARPDGRYDTWYVRDAQTGEFLQGFEHWARVEGALIRYLVEGPMRWLTASPKATSGEDKPAFRVTADGQVHIAHALRYERFQLARVADWQETHAEGYTYRLAPRALARARRQGIRVARVIAFLEQHSQQALPDPLRRALLRWEERGTEVRAAPCVALRATDAAVMETILRLPRLRRLVVARCGPDRVLLRQRDLAAAQAILAESGLLLDEE
jgi:hypothetical protein